MAVILAVVCALPLAACDGPAAPSATGVCWRSASDDVTHPKFESLAPDVTSLDDCAAMLEALHVEGARKVVGAYQGYFIFLDDSSVASSATLEGFRYPIFQPSQRKEIDADLRALIKARNGHAPTPGEISVQRR
jgi:hypothetical protein